MMAEFPVRLSHLLRFCAPGSIVRGADGLVVPMDTRYWVNKYGNPIGELIPRVNRLRSALGIGQELRFPPIATIKMNRLGLPEENTLPAVRFPGWMRCSNCGRLYRFPWTDQKEGVLRCTNKKCEKPGRLVQVPWVLVHEKGYLDDVPWHWLAHRNFKGRDQGQCKDDKHLYLKMDKDSWKVYCLSCGAQEKFSCGAIFAKVFFNNYRKMQQQPWLPEPVPLDEIEDVAPVAIEIGDSRIYSPITQNGLVIPPESRIHPKSIVDKLRCMQDELDGLRRVQERPSLLRSRINKLAGKLRCEPGEIEQAWKLIESDHQDEEANITPGQLSELEYDALITVIPDLEDDEDFVTHHYSEEWRMLEGSLNPSAKVRKIIRIIDQVVSVQRLREIMIYKGFLRPVGGYSDDLAPIPPDLEGKQDWLPALELFGEGIFITINESILHVWEQNKAVIKRARVMQFRKDSSHLPIPLPNPTPRFILLHTLAHLMIRQIEFDSGYPAASLKERLYVQEPIGGNVPTMAGILIYVSVSDKAGSLGGLAELAEPERLLPVLEKVFARADWCSLDPVCTEHDGQGPGLLNRAACHACALVPDTSCSYSNVLLDRVFIKGSTVSEESSTIPPFLDYVDRVSP